MKLPVIAVLFFSISLGTFSKERILISDSLTELNAPADTIQDSLKNELNSLLDQAEKQKSPLTMEEPILIIVK